jgi:predicted glycosyltransferase
MEQRGHEFLLTARDKDCTLELLRAYQLPHLVLSRQARGVVQLTAELVLRTQKVWRQARAFRPDYLLGIMGPSIALAGKLQSSKTVIFYDTEMAWITNWFAYPLADAVCTPDCYQQPVRGRHILYPGYQELAYLHPKRFTPDERVLEEYGLSVDEPIFIVRFVSWKASHDIKESGLSLEGKRRLVAMLSHRGRVLVSSESPLPKDLEPYRFSLPVEHIHHVLAFANLLVGESATMASEAAVLGTHAVFVSKTGRGYTDEQQDRYGLVHNFTYLQEDEALKLVERLAAQDNLKADSARRRAKLLEEKIDVTGWMIELLESRLFEAS